MLEDDPSPRGPLTDRIAAESTDYDSAEARLGVLLAGSRSSEPRERKLLAQVALDKALGWSLMTQVVAPGTVNKAAEANPLFAARGRPAVAHRVASRTALADLEEAQTQQVARDAHAAHAGALAALTALSGIALRVGLVCA